MLPVAQALCEVEYVGITQDTGHVWHEAKLGSCAGEADLKQRSEICNGTVTLEPGAHLVKHPQLCFICRLCQYYVEALHLLIPFFMQLL